MAIKDHDEEALSQTTEENTLVPKIASLEKKSGG